MQIKLKMSDELHTNLGPLMSDWGHIIMKENGEMGDYHLYYTVPQDVSEGSLNAFYEWLNKEGIEYTLIN